MRIILITMLLILFISCDPMDDRLIIQNNTDQDLFARLCFIDNGKIHDTWAGVRLILKNDENVIAILGSWKSEFNLPRPLDLHVIIHNDYNLIASTGVNELKAISDSLIHIGDYVYKTYSYDDLNMIGWKITYPEDIFDNGIPIENN